MDAASIKRDASAWAVDKSTTLEALTPQQKKDVVADVAAKNRVPAAEVAAALLPAWHKTNEDRGMRFGALGGDWQYQGSSTFKPMASVRGMSPVAMQLAQKQLQNVGTFKDIANDTRANALANEGFKLDKAGQHLGAIALYQEALGLEPADPMIRNRLGLAIKHLGPGHHKQALEAIGTALALDPTYPPAHYNAACIAALHGDAKGAAAHLAEALKGNVELFTRLAHEDKDFAKVGGGDAMLNAARFVSQ